MNDTTKIKDIEITDTDNFTLVALHIVNQEGMSLDISKIAPNFRLYETIYNKFVTADLTIVDSLNILKHYRFTGQEFCRVAYRHGSDEDDPLAPVIDKTFRVYQIINVARQKETVQSYQMKLCDPSMFTARSTRMSKEIGRANV